MSDANGPQRSAWERAVGMKARALLGKMSVAMRTALAP